MVEAESITSGALDISLSLHLSEKTYERNQNRIQKPLADSYDPKMLLNYQHLYKRTHKCHFIILGKHHMHCETL